MTAIVWHDGCYDGDNRQLAMCGKVAVGAVFLPGARGRYVRWRVWCTSRMHPVEGSARSLEGARVEVERRFDEFLFLAALAPERSASP